MNPAIFELAVGLGGKALDLFLTKKKNEGIASEKPQFDPSATTIIQHTKAVAAHEAQSRQIAPAKSGIITVIGTVLYLAVQQGYISPASMQCMVDSAQEVQARVIEQQQEAKQ